MVCPYAWICIIISDPHVRTPTSIRVDRYNMLMKPLSVRTDYCVHPDEPSSARTDSNIHTCGWTYNPYSEALLAISLSTRMDTDVRTCSDAFTRADVHFHTRGLLIVRFFVFTFT